MHGTPITRPKFEVADIFRRYMFRYTSEFKMSLEQWTVFRALVGCRTAILGYHEDECDNSTCGHREYSYNSCRNRHCPKCQGSSRFKWLSARLSDLLPVSYFHVVFTLPHGLNDLLMCNKDVLYKLFFKTASYTLLEFAQTPKHLGAKPGFIGILHTWGQTLIYHVHLHFIVTGGGWRKSSNEWIEHKHHEKFLYPIHGMSDVFRGKFIGGLKRLYWGNKLDFPGDLQAIADDDSFESFLNRVCRNRWVCYAKRPFAGPEQVLEYISRYTHRVAVSNNRLLEINDEFIRFGYRDYKDHDTVKTMELTPVQFIRRFMYHVLPKQFTRIRHYGFLAGNTKKKVVPAIRDFLDTVRNTVRKARKESAIVLESILDVWKPRCPVCKSGFMRTIEHHFGFAGAT